MRIRRVLLWTLILLFALSVAAILLFHSAWLKDHVFAYITDVIRQQYGLQLEAKSFNFSLSRGVRIRAEGVRISSSVDGASFARLGTVTVDAPYSILWSASKHIRSVQITDPVLDLDHLPHSAGSGTAGGGAGPGAEIDQILVNGGSITFQQKSFTGVSLDLKLASGRLEVRSASAQYRTAILENLSGTVSLDEPIRYSLDYRAGGDAALVAGFTAGLPALKGPLAAMGTITGENRDFEVKLALQAPELRVEGERPFPLNGELVYRSTGSGAPLSLELDWEAAPLEMLHRIVPGIPQLNGLCKGTIHYSGGSDFWRGEGSLQASLTATSGNLPVGGRIAADLKDGAILLRDSRLDSRSVSAGFSGKVDEDRLQLKVSGHAASIADLSALIPEAGRFHAAAEFDGTLIGPFAAIRIDGILNAHQGDESLGLKGTYDLGSEQVRVAFQAAVSGESLRRLGVKDIDGMIHANGSASGTVVSPVVEADFSARDLSAGGFRVGEVNAVLRSNGKQITASIHIPEYTGQFDATYAWKSGAFDIAGAFNKVSAGTFRALLPEKLRELTGEISGSLQVSGNVRQWQNAQGWFRFEDSQLAHSGFELEIAAGGRLELANGKFAFDVAAQSEGASFHVGGYAPLNPRDPLDLQLTGDADLQAFSRFAQGWEITGRAQAAAEIKGHYEHPAIHGSVSLHGAGANDPQKHILLRDAEGTIESADDGFTASLRGTLNGAALNASASVSLLNQPGKIEMGIHSLDIGALVPGSRAAGILDLTVRAEGMGIDPARWNGSAVLEGADLALDGTPVTMLDPVRIGMEDGLVTVQPFRVRAGDLLDLTAEGSLQVPSQQMNAELTGHGDLSLISVLAPDLQGNGRLNLTVHATGPLQAPVFTGSVRTSGALLRVSGYPFALEDIELDAPFDKRGMTVKTFTARLGGGRVNGDGELSIVDGKPGSLSFRMAGRNVGLTYPEGFRSQVDADLQLKGTLENPVLSGNIQVLRSQYRENIDYRDRLVNTLLAQKRMLAPQGAAGHLHLDLTVKTGQDLRLHNNLAQLSVRGDLRVTGTGSQPRINGQMQIREGGRIIFEGNDYIVDHARISFSGTRDLNPVFDALLNTTILGEERDGSRQMYRITITLKGPLDQLEIEPVSDSDLQKSQIYSLLLTGRVTELGQTASTLFQQQLAAYLGGKLFFDFQNRIAGALGFSRFQIVPSNLILSEEDPDVRLVIGRQVAPGLNVQYSALLSQHTGDTWIVDYRLKNRLNFLFVEQEDGSYTGGLRHNLRFGGTRSSRTRRASSRKFRIARVDLTSESYMGRDALLRALRLDEGQSYDPWGLEDRADELKRKFQQHGSLFPLVEIAETAHGEEVDLQIHVADRGLRSMEFSGMKVVSESRARYETWWREGLSESTVLLQITDDLLLALHRDGYHQARVSAVRNESPGRIVYQFRAEPGARYEQAELAFTGNDGYPSNQLVLDLSALYDSREAMIRDALHRFPAFKDRVQALYVGRGFLDAQVDPGRAVYARGKSSSVVREVHIREGQSWRIAGIEVSGGLVLPPELQHQLKLLPGSLYDSNALSEDEITVTEFYRNQGYLRTRVAAEVRKEPAGDLLLSYRLETGSLARVGSIHVNEGLRTKRGLIEKQISVKPGDVLTPGKLMETQANIAALQLFRQVRVEPRETSTPDLYDVEITMLEAPPYSFTYGLRYDSEEDAEGEVQFQDGNVLGTGRNLLLYGRWSSLNSIYRLVFHTAPEAERRETSSLLPWRSLLSLSYEESENPTFVSKLTSLDAQRRWILFGPVTFLGTLKFEQGRVTSKFNEGPIVFDLKQKVSRLIGVVLVDERDDPFDPRRGFFFTDEVEHAPEFLKSDLVFTKNYTQYFQYFSFGSVVSASAVRVGIAGDLIGSEHFFAGGAATIRGFELDEVGPHSRVTGAPLGGEAVLIFNQEFRFPIHSWLGGVAFFDTGNVYPTLADFSLADLRNTAGFGLRLKSPYGIVRLDLGFNLAPEDNEPSYVFHFGLGQAW